MIKTNEISDPNSCLNKADANEPVFVLRAHDPLAAAIVTEWAVRYRSEKEATNQFDDRAHQKWRSALHLAEQMNAWRRANMAGDIVEVELDYGR